VLRATIKQSQHDFTNSLADLNLALKLDPANAQAWLTKATVLTVLGDYDGARRACRPLGQLTTGLIALTAAVSVASVIDEAEADFKSALALGQPDPYVLGAYADLLLDQGRAQEVVGLLKGQENADALLLRLALAEAALNPQPASLAAHMASLEARFEAGHLRGDFVHQREEARFTLALLRQPLPALRLAQTDWQVQREPADVRILLETARAAGDPAAAQPALDFVRTNHLEDVQSEKIARQFATLAAAQ
jgi:tetratricopeptide (TPR) repeat protein